LRVSWKEIGWSKIRRRFDEESTSLFPCLGRRPQASLDGRWENPSLSPSKADDASRRGARQTVNLKGPKCGQAKRHQKSEKGSEKLIWHQRHG
jgi:hypothetical protein